MLHTGDLIHPGLLRFVSGYIELLRKMLVGLGSEEIPANYFYFNMRNDDVLFSFWQDQCLCKRLHAFFSYLYTTFKKQ